jgi:hypothetical protein
MKPVRTLVHALFVAAAMASLAGCQQRVTEKKFNQIGNDGLKTEDEVRKFLGPGVEVKDSYTDLTVEVDKLPANARFVRYPDADKPGVLHHVVYVDGKVLQKDDWIPGKTAEDREKWVEIARKEYEKKHATNSAAPATAPK